MWQKIRHIGIEIYCFLTAPLVAKSCLGIFAAFCGFVLLTALWLKCYTNHNESMETPNYVGLSYAEARKKARNRDFNVEIADSIFQVNTVPGMVLSQNPEPGSRVKEGRTLYFTVSKNNPDLIKLPSLRSNDEYERYSKTLARLGLKPRIVGNTHNSKLEPNTIVAVIYKGDTVTHKLEIGVQVAMGEYIDFVVSEQLGLDVVVPDCVCKTYDAAKFLIISNNLTLGTTVKDATVTNIETAYVMRQTPSYAADTKIRVGEQIDLYLTQKPPSGCPDN
jgi:beta-lactam-binding protein with PASTA domain